MSCPRPNTVRSNPKDVGELAEPLRSRIWTAMQDAPRKKLVLVSGFRDPGRQWDLRHERCRGRECDRGCKGYPVTAVPYASNHQKRLAADMGGYDLDWLINNRQKYGLGLTVRSENWHFEASGTDSRTGKRIGSPTVRIIPFGNTPTPTPTPKPKDEFMAALTEAEQREMLTNSRLTVQNMQKRAFAMRDPRDGRVWVFGDGGRWWVRNMEALNIMVWHGLVAGFPASGIPVATVIQIEGVPEVDVPTDVEALIAALPAE